MVVLAGTPARCVLLIQRAGEPFAGQWALPGGFVDQGEPVRHAGPRELEEETGVVVPEAELVLLGVWDTPGRDPRGWSVSVVWMCALTGEQTPQAGDDAAAARWWAVDELPPLAFDHADILAAALALEAGSGEVA
ncbi:MAG: hypothetical protein NVS1B9_03570 [Solirubrobacteraceae bacterium]